MNDIHSAFLATIGLDGARSWSGSLATSAAATLLAGRMFPACIHPRMANRLFRRMDSGRAENDSAWISEQQAQAKRRALGRSDA
jgi:hypothetical protein